MARKKRDEARHSPRPATYGVVAYLPPDYGFSGEFTANLNENPARVPIVFYSDGAGGVDGVRKIPSPAAAVQYRNTPLSINNYVFIQGLRIAISERWDYFLYLEEDCRVRGDGWAREIFDEFFEVKALFGGTVSIANIGLCGARNTELALGYAVNVMKHTGRPPLLWSALQKDKATPGVWTYPNGALGIYHTATTASYFSGHEYDMGTYCANLGAWDVHIGKGLWAAHKEDCFDMVMPLKSVYSGYHDTQYSLHDRKKMLETGQIVAVHQIKEKWRPKPVSTLAS